MMADRRNIGSGSKSGARSTSSSTAQVIQKDGTESNNGSQLPFNSSSREKVLQNIVEGIRDVFGAYKMLSKLDSKYDLYFVINHLHKVLGDESNESEKVANEGEPLETIRTVFEAYKMLSKWEPETASEILIESLEKALNLADTGIIQQNLEPIQVKVDAEDDDIQIVWTNEVPKDRTTTVGAPESVPTSSTSMSVPVSGVAQTNYDISSDQGLESASPKMSTVVASSSRSRRSVKQVKFRRIYRRNSSFLKKFRLKKVLMAHRSIVQSRSNKISSSVSQCESVRLNNDAADILNEETLRRKYNITGNIQIILKKIEPVISSKRPDRLTRLRRPCTTSDRIHGNSGKVNKRQSKMRKLRKESDATTFHACKYCQKQFSVYYIAMHERIHTGEKPYKCQYCQKSFTQAGYLKIHERIHTGEKPYKCRYCKKAFICHSYMKSHEEVHKRRTRNYKCKHCEKKFLHIASLKKHERNSVCRKGRILSQP